MEPARKKETLWRTSHHEHSHALSSSEVPLIWRALWSSKVCPSFQASLAQGRGRDSSPAGPSLCWQLFVPSRSTIKRDIIKTMFEWFQQKILSLLPALVPLFSGPLQLQQHYWSCVWGWAASACSGQKQSWEPETAASTEGSLQISRLYF